MMGKVLAPEPTLLKTLFPPEVCVTPEKAVGIPKVTGTLKKIHAGLVLSH